ncbi:MAG: hypothetical protein H6582_12295 [Crocinitomicaceae bacterium]|nr:hypothetical protein [Crocinitomicaceae bacterium]
MKSQNLKVDQDDFEAMCYFEYLLDGFVSGNIGLHKSFDKALFDQFIPIFKKYPSFKSNMLDSAIPLANMYDGRPHNLAGAESFKKLIADL